MKKLLLLSLLLLIVVGFIQKPSEHLRKTDILISEDKPPVYITFENYIERTPQNKNESEKKILLRVHNNLRCAISLLSDGIAYNNMPSYKQVDVCNGSVLALEDGTEEDLIYQILASHNTIITQEKDYHNILGGYSWLQSGNSVVFSVERNHLTDNLAILISVNYEWEWKWEGGKPIQILGDQKHLIYFRSSNLSQN